MKNATIASEGTQYVAVNLGKFNNLMDYAYDHPRRKQIINGKVFTGEVLRSTGAEVSFQLVPAGEGIPFLHQHRNHEEIYVVLKGSGQFQVNESVFNIEEGSVIRVAPNGKRAYLNNSNEPLVFMCIQAVAGSLDSYFGTDGLLAQGGLLWDK